MGRTFEGPDTGEVILVADEPVLASCYAASAGGRGTLRLVSSPSTTPPPPRALVAEVCGIHVHADVAVDGRDRARLERVCRYLGRPAVAQERLSQLEDGRLCYRLKKRWADGTHSIVLRPHDFLARIVALIPAPRFHLIRYAGVLAAHSTLRRAVVPGRRHEPKPSPQLLLWSAEEHASPVPGRTAKVSEQGAQMCHRRYRWASLLKRVFKVDVTECPRCRGRLRLLEVCTTAYAIERLLRDEGIEPVTHARAPPCTAQLELAR
jgi:hypothetical protein